MLEFNFPTRTATYTCIIDLHIHSHSDYKSSFRKTYIVKEGIEQ